MEDKAESYLVVHNTMEDEDESYLVVHNTMEDEDEESLKAVQDGEDVCHGNWLLVDEEQPEYPGQPQQDNKHHGSLHPRPGQQKRVRL